MHAYIEYIPAVKDCWRFLSREQVGNRRPICRNNMVQCQITGSEFCSEAPILIMEQRNTHKPSTTRGTPSWRPSGCHAVGFRALWRREMWELPCFCRPRCHQIWTERGVLIELGLWWFPGLLHVCTSDVVFVSQSPGLHSRLKKTMCITGYFEVRLLLFEALQRWSDCLVRLFGQTVLWDLLGCITKPQFLSASYSRPVEQWHPVCHLSATFRCLSSAVFGSRLITNGHRSLHFPLQNLLDQVDS